MKTILSKKFINVGKKIIISVGLVLIVSVTNPAFASIPAENQTQQTDDHGNIKTKFSNVKCTQKNLKSNKMSGVDQKNVSDNPPPPGDTIPNKTYIPSGILPLLAMALGLILWRVHLHIQKSKKQS